MFHGSRLRTLEKRLTVDNSGYCMYLHDGKTLYDMVTWEPKYLLPDHQQVPWSKADCEAPVGHLYAAGSIHLANPSEPGITNKAMQRKVRKWQKTHIGLIELVRPPEPKSTMTAKSMPIETDVPYMQKEDPPETGPPKPAETMEEAVIAVPAVADARKPLAQKPLLSFPGYRSIMDRMAEQEECDE